MKKKKFESSKLGFSELLKNEMGSVLGGEKQSDAKTKELKYDFRFSYPNHFYFAKYEPIVFYHEILGETKGFRPVSPELCIDCALDLLGATKVEDIVGERYFDKLPYKVKGRLKMK